LRIGKLSGAGKHYPASIALTVYNSLMSNSTSDELLEAALVGLRLRLSEIDLKIADIYARISGRGGSREAKRVLSAAARRRIAEAQRKRWAVHREHTKAKRRELSPAAKKRIADATKKRWAKYRAAKAAATSKLTRKKRSQTPTPEAKS
jgi:hypothetical protein